jgi:hypothetical protein
VPSLKTNELGRHVVLHTMDRKSDDINQSPGLIKKTEYNRCPINADHCDLT